MQSDFIPSYVSKSRHGIYYFRCRIPLSVRNKYNLSKAEIKKSLHTSNHSDAVKKARRLWLELIDENINGTDHLTMIAIGKPKGKIDLILHLPKAVEKIRELYSVSGNDSTIPRMSHYLSKLGDDPDVVSEFIKNLTEDEKKNLTKYEPYKRACLIIKYHQKTSHTQRFESRPITTIQDNPNELIKITIAECLSKYYKWYINDREENKNKKVPPKTKDDKTRTLEIFRIILQKHKFLCDLTSAIIEKEYVVKVKRIPARLNNIYKYHPVKKNHEILELHIDEIVKKGITETRVKKSNDTLNREFVTIKMFLKWAEKRNYVKVGLGHFIPSMAENTENAQPKPVFTDNDLTLLFNSKSYVNGTFSKKSDFWMPLIALFTGARGNEIAFLFKEDIKKHPENGIWYIHIRANKEIEKRTKSKSSVRSIPVHSQLIKLGFLEYVTSTFEGTRIFPELNETKNNKGDFYQSFGNKFNRYEVETKNNIPVINQDGSPRMRRGYMTQCGVEKIVTLDGQKRSKTFHSFRHYMINYLDRVTTPRIKNFITGHKYDSKSDPNYIHPDPNDLKESHNTLQLLSFPSINFKVIKTTNWESR